MTVALLLCSGIAQADGPANDKALAEALFRDARQLSDGGNVSAACPKFAESQRLDPKLGTLLNLAACHEQDGKTASAWAEFTQAASQAEHAQRKEREKFARDHADALQKKLAQLTLTLAAPGPGIELKVDGSSVGPAVLGMPFPVDPGDHLIEATAPNKESWSRHALVPQGPGNTMVEVPSLRDVEAPAAAAPIVPPLAAPTPAAPATAPPSTAGRRGWAALAMGLGLAGGAGIAIGAAFGLRTFSEKNAAAPLCPGTTCTPTGLADEATAHRYANVSTVGFAAGLAAVAGGVAVIIFSGHTRAQQGRLQLGPLVGSHESGVLFSGSL